MSLPKVFLTRRIPQGGLDLLAGQVDAEVWPDDLPPSPDVLHEKIQHADGLLTMLSDPIDADLIRSTSRPLKVISQYAVGFDNIDLAAANERGIPVGNTPGALTDATADLTWALLMAAARHVVAGDRFTRSGQWRTWGPTFMLGSDFTHATLGVVGFGRIGQAVARRAQGFDMHILYTSAHRHEEAEAELSATYTTLDKLLAQSDFVSLHTPLTPQTHHLISHAQFAQMKSGAVLVNTARGSIVDPQALYQALSDHRIASAALDVTEPEPISAGDPLLSLDNLIITPHIGSAGIQARTRMAEMAVANLLAGLRGERLPHCVNPMVYAK
jgi:glyoxylate reductase